MSTLWLLLVLRETKDPGSGPGPFLMDGSSALEGTGLHKDNGGVNGVLGRATVVSNL